VILTEDNAGTIAILGPDSSNLGWIDVNNPEAVALKTTQHFPSPKLTSACDMVTQQVTY
jgi:hypothetical protein